MFNKKKNSLNPKNPLFKLYITVQYGIMNIIQSLIKNYLATRSKYDCRVLEILLNKHVYCSLYSFSKTEYSVLWDKLPDQCFCIQTFILGLGNKSNMVQVLDETLRCFFLPYSGLLQIVSPLPSFIAAYLATVNKQSLNLSKQTVFIDKTYINKLNTILKSTH